ncbi:MAG: hypothetical protein J0L63_06925 [Anaerolineae bacterium]|nr:hypothetical protein [Anaerolineae bacterium]MBN8618619.1 hypothetical protein [Anaerolineae bacterium]
MNYRLQFPQQLFPDNAIMRAERVYQSRSDRWRWRWIQRAGQVFLMIGVVLSIISVGMMIISSLWLKPIIPYDDRLNVVIYILTLFTVVWHFSLLLRTMSLSAHSIVREKEAHTWELMILTGVDARQIVRGKWWATIQQQWKRYLILAILRIGIIVWLAGLQGGWFSGTSSIYYTRTQIELAHPVSIVWGVAFIFIVTFANLGYTAACGVVASVSSRRSSSAIARGLIQRTVIALLPIIVLYLVYTQIRWWSQPLSSILGILAASAITLVDNGISVGSLLVGMSYNYMESGGTPVLRDISVDGILASAVAVVGYALITWFALWRAERRAIHEMASPRETPSQNK